MWWIVKTTLRKVLCWVCQWFFLNWWIFGIGKIQAKSGRLMTELWPWVWCGFWFTLCINIILIELSALTDWVENVTAIQVPLFILPCFSIEEQPANETSSRETTLALKYTHVAVCYVHCHLSHHCGNSELTCHTGSQCCLPPGRGDIPSRSWYSI